MTTIDRTKQLEQFYAQLQDYGRIYTFRDPNAGSYLNLRVNECYVLDFIVEKGPITVSELAECLGVHKSNASRIAASLQKRGLLEAATDPGDKRSFILCPTSDGQSQHKEIKKRFVGMLNSILKDFEKEEIDTAMRVISVLTDAAENRIVESPQ